jgi:hypothetical protein
MNLEIPEHIVLADGTTAHVKAVKGTVIDGRLGDLVYTIEKENGAWADVAGDELLPPTGSAAVVGELIADSSTVLAHGTLKAEDAVANASMVSEGGHLDVPMANRIEPVHDARHRADESVGAAIAS